MMHGIFNLLNTRVRGKSVLADNSAQHIYKLKVNRIKLELKTVNKPLNICKNMMWMIFDSL